MKYLHNVSRVEAFSDAVFAFAATLLVVSVGSDNSSSILRIDWVVFLSFGVSFFVLVSLWWLHYNFFRRTDYMDNWIIAINAVLLFVILYYIFPLKSLINSMTGKVAMRTIEDLGTLFQLYSLGFFLIFGCLALMYYRVYAKTKSTKPNIQLLFYTRHFGIYVGVSILSILLSTFQIGLDFFLPGIIYVLLGPLCYAHGKLFNLKYQTDI
ncbi:MAG: TMEM175 family protein [Bacteroidota bacterium]